MLQQVVYGNQNHVDEIPPKPDFLAHMPTVKNGDGSIMLLIWFSSTRQGRWTMIGIWKEWNEEKSCKKKKKLLEAGKILYGCYKIKISLKYEIYKLWNVESLYISTNM